MAVLMIYVLPLLAHLVAGLTNFERSANPNISTLTPTQFSKDGAQRVQIKYGPFEVPASSIDMGMKEFWQEFATVPCTDCLLTQINANLTYPNGTYANAHNGMWLHHTVLFDSGRPDIVCPMAPANRFFASGNERTPFDFTINGTSKTGYYIAKNSTFAVQVELMNEVDEPRAATLTVDYEYIPGMPPGFNDLDNWWFDVGGICGNSEMDVPANQDVFSYTAQAYKATTGGSIVMAGGHLHDGGVQLTVSRNNRSTCTFTPSYGLGYGYVDMNPMNMSSMPGMQDMNDSMPMTHISNMSTCSAPINGYFSSGDEFEIKAEYNATAHPLMMGPGNQPEPVMGIALVYVKKTNSSGSGPSGDTSTGKVSTSGAESVRLPSIAVCLIATMITLAAAGAV